MVCQQPACEDFHYFFYQMHCSLTVLWGIFRFLTSSLTNFVQGLIFDNFWIFLGIKAWTCFFLSHILISRNYFPFYIPTPVPSSSLLPFPIHFLEELICQLVQMFNLIFWLKKKCSLFLHTIWGWALSSACSQTLTMVLHLEISRTGGGGVWREPPGSSTLVGKKAKGRVVFWRRNVPQVCVIEHLVLSLGYFWRRCWRTLSTRSTVRVGALPTSCSVFLLPALTAIPPQPLWALWNHT